MDDDTILSSGLSVEELNLISLEEESIGFESSELASELLPEVTSQSEFWLVSIMAVLTMVILIHFFKQRVTVKSSDNDSALRAELIETENKDASAA